MTTVIVGLVCFVVGGVCGVFCAALAAAAKNRDNLYEERD